MQRRVFSISAASAAAATAFGGLATSARAQRKAPQEGTDYVVLDRPAPVEAPAGKVEVVEFFWYSCPHCNRFEPALEEWIKKTPKDVVVRRVPVAFRPDFEPQQRLYYVLEGMQKVQALHAKVFHAIHVERQLLNTPDLVADWAEKQGLNRAQFTVMYNSATVITNARKATLLQDAYKIDGVPALGIAGRFYTSGSLAQTMDRALWVTDHLITQARKA